jgi:hypothetical protein
MIYLKWTSAELATLRDDALYTEIDEDGWVQREVALTPAGAVSHQAIPSLEQPGWFGLSRLSLPMLESNITRSEFERIWQRAAAR